MRSETTFQSTHNLSLWIKKTCLTIDYEGEAGFLRQMTYLSSYLTKQLHDNDYSIPSSKELAFIFMLRNQDKIPKFINSLIPPHSLDRVAISIPETNDFIILNEIELDSPESYHMLKNYAFFPSGLIEILPKNQAFLPPGMSLDWQDQWEMIENNTSAFARKIYCSSFAFQTEKLVRGDPDDEENLKRLLGKDGMSIASLLNFLDSATTVTGSPQEMHDWWRLRPEEENDPCPLLNMVRTADNSESTDHRSEARKESTKHRAQQDSPNRIMKKVIPGKASYTLLWNGTRTACKRNYHVDPKYESKRQVGNLTTRNPCFLTKKSKKTLEELKEEGNIDALPAQFTGMNPRRLTYNEKEAVRPILFSRLKNCEYWNPRIMIHDIADSKLLRLWTTAYNTFKIRTEKFLMRKSEHLEETVEFISLLELNNRRGKIKENEWPGLDKLKDAHPSHEREIWHNCTRSIIQKTLLSAAGDNNNKLFRVANEGASYLDIIRHTERVEAMMPTSHIPPIETDLKDYEIFAKNVNGRTLQADKACWVIEKFSQRNDRIWNFRERTHFQGQYYASSPIGAFNCYSGNEKCLGKIICWINPDLQDARAACRTTCTIIWPKRLGLNQEETTSAQIEVPPSPEDTLPTMQTLPIYSSASSSSSSSSNPSPVLLPSGKRVIIRKFTAAPYCESSPESTKYGSSPDTKSPGAIRTPARKRKRSIRRLAAKATKIRTLSQETEAVITLT